jgi:YebC/PmpR family DNA-binding regulatory protein
MAGHSRWANIKHKKARSDAVKGKVWSKCARALMVAARHGGSDPDSNLTLRYAIDEARAANMPKDTIEKAIKKGAGELGTESYEQVRYEAYGPGGVAMIIECLTNNLNRTAPELRMIFEKAGGNLAKPGAVAFGFSPRGLLLIELSKVSEERLMELALDAGAEDVVEADGAWEVTCEPGQLHAVKQALSAADIECDSAELTMMPATVVPCSAAIATRVLRLVDELEDNDDVQKVYHNAQISADVAEQLRA